jgi:hypothetical protein
MDADGQNGPLGAMHFILAFLLFPASNHHRMHGCSAGIQLSFRRQAAKRSPAHQHVTGFCGSAASFIGPDG